MLNLDWKSFTESDATTVALTISSDLFKLVSLDCYYRFEKAH